MQPLKNILDQIMMVWRTSTPAARLGIGLLTVACAAIIAGVGYWSVQPYYVELVANLDANKVEGLLTDLDRANIKYELRGGGNMIMVDKRGYAQARMIADKLGVMTSEITDQSPGPFAPLPEYDRIALLNKENHLEQMLKKIQAVESADVKIAVPETRGFFRDEAPPSASVLLKLKPQVRFGETQANAIAGMVAGAVPGLDKSKVVITDQFGREYSLSEDGQLMGRTEQTRVEREQALRQEILNILSPVTGFENVTATVSLDLSVLDSRLTTSKVDPDNSVATTQTIETKSMTDTTPDEEAGAAGITSNLAGRENKSKKILEKTENNNSSFKFGETSETQIQKIVKVNRMTVSVIVNSKLLEASANGGTPVTKEQIESLVASAVGLDRERDTIAIEFLPFQEVPTADTVAQPAIPWEQINEILRNISLAIAALVALFVGWTVTRKFRPSPLRGAMGLALSEDGVQRISQLTQLAEKNPEVFAKIIASWAKASENKGKDNANTNAAKAA